MLATKGHVNMTPFIKQINGQPPRNNRLSLAIGVEGIHCKMPLCKVAAHLNLGIKKQKPTWLATHARLFSSDN